MKKILKIIVTLACVVVVGGVAMINPDKANASDKYDYQRSHYRDGGYQKGHGAYRVPRVIHHGPTIVVPDRRIRRYHNTYVYRPHGHWYRGYGRYYADDDAFAWLAFTAITLKVLDNLNEEQQRVHEQAQIRATTVPIGETVIWNKGGASGPVAATRDGTSTSGRSCLRLHLKY